MSLRKSIETTQQCKTLNVSLLLIVEKTSSKKLLTIVNKYAIIASTTGQNKPIKKSSYLTSILLTAQGIDTRALIKSHSDYAHMTEQCKTWVAT